MKITDVGSSKKTTQSKGKRVESGRAGEFARQLKESAESSNSAPSAELGAIGGVDSVLTIQESTSATGGKSRSMASRYGEDLLGRLDELRHGILDGTFSKEKLADLAKTMRARRQESDDPKLNEIINEIELRAQVEIAKLTRES
ncbi:MAG: flagellar assembly protein FliX [Rhodospirillales bacterium]|nr:flagellar assembly protein FliX [Rhodospirillales bacterium]